MDSLTLAQPSEKAWSTYLLPAIVILAIVIRLSASFVLKNLDAEPRHDELVFTRIASNLVEGRGYSANGEMPTTWRPPAYPLLLSAITAVFGHNWVLMRIVNILLNVSTIPVIYLISARLFNRTTAWVAALIAAFYPAFIRFSLIIHSEPLYVLMVSLMILMFIKIYDHPKSWKTKLGAGIFLGLATLTRSEMSLFFPLIGLWTLLIYRRLFPAVRATLIIVLPAILLVLPWLVRNYLVFDKVVMATNLGFLMWGVHNPETFGDISLMGGHHIPEFKMVKNAGEVPRERWDPELTYLPEIEWDQVQTRWALETIQENVDLLPRLIVYKLHRLVFTPGAIRDFMRFPLVYFFFFGLIVLLISGDQRFSIFYMMMLFAVVITAAFYTNERLRMVLDPTFIIVASFGLVQQIMLLKRTKDRQESIINVAAPDSA